MAAKRLSTGKSAALVLVLCGASIGCVPQKAPQQYYWGDYQQVVYDMYMKPGQADPGQQIVRLSQDVQKAAGEGKSAAPGVHAHLGYAYYLNGQLDAAVEQFSVEKELFPDAATFMDTLIGQITSAAGAAATQ